VQEIMLNRSLLKLDELCFADQAQD